MDSDSLPVSSSPIGSRFICLGRQAVSFEQRRQRVPLPAPDVSAICVRIRYNRAQRQWRLAPAESNRLALIYRLGWLPKKVQGACESSRTMPGHVFTLHISREDYRSIFHV